MTTRGEAIMKPARTRPWIPTVLAAAALAAAACGKNAGATRGDDDKGDKIQPAVMSITGTATLDVAPDTADISMTMTADGARPKQAVTSLHARQAELVKALMDMDIETADIKISQLGLNPVYVYPENAPPRIRGYQATLTVTASTRKFDLIGDIMEAGAGAGVSTMATTFRCSDLPELKKKVRDMAIAAAREKADQMAHGFGVKMKRVTLLNEAAAGNAWYFDPAFANAAGAETEAARAKVSLSPELQPLVLTVTVAYELE
jgi:uncharacterized protein